MIGEPGVGKTAVAEGLAQRIIDCDVPETLEGKQVITLDLTLLIAGANFRGEFEDRFQKIISEVQKAKNIILFIDEVHTLVGTGKTEGSADAANILKPALSRGELQCIGATTNEEYKEYIEKDAALERRFQPVNVGEPSVDETIEILVGLRDRYEKHHNVSITDEALSAAANLADQYLADRFLPDKAIDLIDEAGSRVRLLNSGLPIAAIELNKELKATSKSKENAVRIENYLKAENLRKRELEIKLQINAITASVRGGMNVSNTVMEVTSDVIAEVVSALTKIPIKKIDKNESEKLLKMEESLHTKIIGQHEAVGAVSRAIRRARVGMRNPERPIASFIFSGPTGVGKTELTKALAAYFFGSNKSMIRLDMSEYMERHTVAKLIGSPPGYVGYKEGGQLTEAIRRNPYTLVLFDEIEKAHPDIFNLLLQIFEDGRLTDSKGRTVSFKNTLLIMTSNIGSSIIEKHTDLGFDPTKQTKSHYEELKGLVNKELKTHFRPEFLNRIDEIVIFRQLTKYEVGEIAEILLKEVSERLKTRGITLDVTDAFKTLLISKGYHPSYGARPLRRAVMRLLEDKLADGILSGNFAAGNTALVDIGVDGEVTILPGKEEDIVKIKEG